MAVIENKNKVTRREILKKTTYPLRIEKIGYKYK